MLRVWGAQAVPSMGCAPHVRPRAAPVPPGSGLDEPAPDRVARELDAVAHPELLEDVRAVAFDGLLGDVQQLADLLVRVRLGDELDDLLLARSEQFVVQRLAGA